MSSASTQKPAEQLAVVSAADARKDHQKFSQWLKYQLKKTDDEDKLAQVSNISSMYKELANAEDRRNFIARWVRNGGSKRDLKVMVAQEMEFNTTSKKKGSTGMLLPGQIAELRGLKQATYKDQATQALRFLIVQNQETYPPKGPRVVEGFDFWTSQYAFKVVGMQEEEASSETKQKINKAAELGGALANTASLAGQLLDVDVAQVRGLTADGEKGKEAKPDKAHALLARRPSWQKQFANLVGVMAKGRTMLLLNNMEPAYAKVQEAQGDFFETFWGFRARRARRLL